MGGERPGLSETPEKWFEFRWGYLFRPYTRIAVRQRAHSSMVHNVGALFVGLDHERSESVT